MIQERKPAAAGSEITQGLEVIGFNAGGWVAFYKQKWL